MRNQATNDVHACEIPTKAMRLSKIPHSDNEPKTFHISILFSKSFQHYKLKN